MTNSRISILDAPSILGLKPSGVEKLPEVLKAAGLIEALNAQYLGRIQPSLPYSFDRDRATQLLNGKAIRAFSLQLAESLNTIVRERTRFIIVLGGDCSIIIGALLALRRVGRCGLFFIDGHADFYQPEASVSGEVADMDLAIVSGRGPDMLTNIDGLKPLVRDEDIVVFGYRDAKQAEMYGSQDVMNTNMHVFDLSRVNELGIANASSLAIRKLLENRVDGFWIHLDADVLDDSIMPAVDYRLEGGLSFSELSDLLRILYSSGLAVGMSITIFNPRLDSDGSIARKFVSSIVKGLL
ncbi:MAG: arginase family protein [Nitrososphaeraceae archaeon]